MSVNGDDDDDDVQSGGIEEDDENDDLVDEQEVNQEDGVIAVDASGNNAHGGGASAAATGAAGPGGASKDSLFGGKFHTSRAVPKDERITSSYMTKYEKARVLGTRALQISMNAPLMIDPGNETDPLRIAQMELRERLIPIIIRRYLPSGDYEDWSIAELIVD